MHDFPRVNAQTVVQLHTHTRKGTEKRKRRRTTRQKPYTWFRFVSWSLFPFSSTRCIRKCNILMCKRNVVEHVVKNKEKATVVLLSMRINKCAHDITFFLFLQPICTIHKWLISVFERKSVWSRNEWKWSENQRRRSSAAHQMSFY